VKQQLKSTASFAKGRALLQAALTQPIGETRRELLKNSEASLLEALHFNNQDLEIAYVLGLAQLSSVRPWRPAMVSPQSIVVGQSSLPKP